MLFNSFSFLVFFGVILLTYQLLPHRFRKGLLLLGSYGFYAAWDWRFLPLIWFSTLLDFFIGKQIGKTISIKVKKRWLYLSLAGNLLPLAFFKYYSFLLQNATILLSNMLGLDIAFPHWNILLPVGISFYTFQTLSYSIDLYRRRIEPTKSLFDFALFVAFFPQLVAGPIEKARNLLPQLQILQPLKKKAIRYGLLTFSFGLTCKVLIADTAGRWVDQTFSSVESLQPIEAILASFLFSIQIYMDFSGYSLMAIGLAHCFGIRLSTNFTQPYLSANVMEFWRRWHITLSSWLREYVYIPLGGNRKGKARQYLNLMLTMLVGGLWHGANWTFVVWGGLHGLWLILHRIAQKLWPNTPKWMLPLQVLLTFTITTAVWVFFRAASIDQAFQILGLWKDAILGWSQSSLIWDSVLWQPLLWCGGAMLLLDGMQRYYGTPLFLRKWPIAMQYAVLLAVWGSVLLLLVPHKPQPFIYFQF